MREKKGVRKKQCKIKVSVKRNGGERRDVEDGEAKVEMGVKKIEIDKQIKLENAVLDFIRIIEMEKLKRGLGENSKNN